MKPVKLDRRQLQSIILGEVKKVRKSALNEMPKMYGPGKVSRSQPEIEQISNDLYDHVVDVVASNFKGMWNSEDPTMAHAGQDAWDDQCDEAASDFVMELDPHLREVAAEIFSKLHNGDYFRGSFRPGLNDPRRS